MTANCMRCLGVALLVAIGWCSAAKAIPVEIQYIGVGQYYYRWDNWSFGCAKYYELEHNHNNPIGDASGRSGSRRFAFGGAFRFRSFSNTHTDLTECKHCYGEFFDF